MINVGKNLKVFSESSLEEGLVEKIESIAGSPCLPDWVDVIDSSKAARVCSFVHGSAKYLFKAFLKRDALESLKNIFLGTRALRAKSGTNLLDRNGFNVPTVICTGSGRGVNVGDSFIVTEFIESDFNLAVFLMDVSDISKRRELVKALGRTIGRMHSKNIYHGDLRPGNILIKSLDDRFDFYFIDNERNKGLTKPNESMVVTNLVQLNMLQLSIVGRTNRARFYKEYCGKIGMDREQAVKVAGLVWGRTEERMDKDKFGGLYS